MDFEFALFLALLIAGAIILWDRSIGRPKRIQQSESGGAARMPLLVEYSRSFFPVILAVFLLRAFVVEPFRIPSGSMLPSLFIGDFILVSKSSYGIKLPVLKRQIIPIANPERGDVMVFRFPRDPKTNFIKRVIGTPGDLVVYHNKRLSINGQPVPLESVDLVDWPSEDQVERIKTFCKYIKLSTPEEIIQLEAVANSLRAPKWLVFLPCNLCSTFI